MEMIVADHRDRIPTNVLLLSHARAENDLRTLFLNFVAGAHPRSSAMSPTTLARDW